MKRRRRKRMIGFNSKHKNGITYSFSLNSTPDVRGTNLFGRTRLQLIQLMTDTGGNSGSYRRWPVTHRIAAGRFTRRFILWIIKENQIKLSGNTIFASFDLCLEIGKALMCDKARCYGGKLYLNRKTLNNKKKILKKKFGVGQPHLFVNRDT